MTSYDYENLVFSGGAMRGAGFIGTLRNLEEKGILDNIKRYAGSSAGSLCAGCLACGCTVDQLREIITNVDPDIFRSHGFGGIIRKLITLFKNYGIYRTKEFKKWIETCIESICNNKNITFQEVYDRYGNELVITGTTLNPTLGETVYFSRHTGFGDMRIVDAMVISTCLPLYFQAIKYQNSLYVDGGLLDYLPLHIFDRELFGGNGCLNHKTIGISMTRLAHHGNFVPPYYELLIRDNPMPASLFIVIDRLVDSIYAHSQWSYERSFDKERVIEIDSSGFDPLNFHLTDGQKQTLMDRGYHAAQEFFEQSK